MRKMKTIMIMGGMVLTLSACGKTENPKEAPINVSDIAEVDDTAKISDNGDGTKEATDEGTASLDP